jgi:hypothetical protein
VNQFNLDLEIITELIENGLSGDEIKNSQKKYSGYKIRGDYAETLLNIAILKLPIGVPNIRKMGPIG